MTMRTTIVRAFERHTDTVVESMQRILPDVEKGAFAIKGALRRGGKVLACGNGGSAADAQHFAAEFVGRYKKERKSLAAIALTTDTSALTAIGNDYGYESVFKRQIEALGKKGDVLVAFTTSGRSQNVLSAIAAAKKKGMKVVVLTGKKGLLGNGADVTITVPSLETARIQEVHEIVFHAWCEAIGL